MGRVYMSLMLLLLVATPSLMMGVVKVAMMAKPKVKGVPMAETNEISAPIYKDFYSKTQVIVTHPVSTVLYQETDLSTFSTLDEDVYSTTVHYQDTPNATTVTHQDSISTVPIVPSPSYDVFEWPTETQIYTTAYNATSNTTVTRTAEHAVPFL